MSAVTHVVSRYSPRPDAIAFRVSEVRQMGGPGKTKLYELARQGKLRLVRVGGRTLVEGDSLRTLLREGC
jgi:hypothetical protein